MKYNCFHFIIPFIYVALLLQRMDVGMDTMGNPQYEFPKEATEYLRKLTGGPAKREKRQVNIYQFN
jgi:hypothetical protein